MTLEIKSEAVAFEFVTCEPTIDIKQECKEEPDDESYDVPDSITSEVMIKVEDKINSKRKTYSVEFKKETVEACLGKNLTNFCREKHLNIRMVRKWRDEYENLNQDTPGKVKKRKRGTGRPASHPELEQILYKWYNERKAEGSAVRRGDVQAYALAMAAQCTIPIANFRASQHWLDGFLERYGIQLY